jgi:hypothetical protein
MCCNARFWVLAFSLSSSSDNFSPYYPVLKRAFQGGSEIHEALLKVVKVNPQILNTLCLIKVRDSLNAPV